MIIDDYDENADLENELFNDELEKFIKGNTTENKTHFISCFFFRFVANRVSTKNLNPYIHSCSLIIVIHKTLFGHWILGISNFFL